ncbi:MAG: hypothetical protein AB7K24_19245 [Gemmataceae bacterium]
MQRRTCYCLLTLLLAGCGSNSSSTMRVWGEVTLDGQPVEEGEIVFVPAAGAAGPSTGGPIQAGRYDIAAAQGPRAGGKYQVQIQAFGPPRSYSPNASGEGPFVEVRDNLAPARYNQQSTLSVQIAATAADNQHDFRLER